VVGFCEYSDEPSDSGAMELVNFFYACVRLNSDRRISGGTLTTI
jgi:hypothetical protein